jgi:drug/metabolite transporter (DMT)-like permease
MGLSTGVVRGGVIRCGAAAVLFGISAPLASTLTDDMGAFTLAGLLYIGAAIAVIPFVGRNPPTRRDVRVSLPNLSLAVVLGGAVGPVLLAAGLGLVPAATASLLLNLELVFTTIVASLIFHEYLGRNVVAGTGLVVAGTVVLSWSGNPTLRWGAVLIAGACLCWAIDNSATAALDRISPSQITLAKGVFAGGTNLVIGLSLTDIPSAGPVLAALVIGGFGYGASITLWVSGARELGAARGQLIFATAPFIGALVAWSVLDEVVTGRQLVAFLIAAGGIAFVIGSDHEHEHRHRALEHTHAHIHDRHHDHDHDQDHDVGGLLPERHTHLHLHPPLAHRHPHLPDLHHRHRHRHRHDQ